MGSDPCRCVNAPLDIHPEMHADPAADFFGLLHHPARHHTGSRIGRDDVERRAGQRREGVEAEIAPQLEPDTVANLGMDFGRETACPKRLCEPSNPFGLRPSRALGPERVIGCTVYPGGPQALSSRSSGSTVGHRGDALRLQVRELALESAKIPGNAVCAVTTAVSGPRSGFI
jgi:hypothetical protein